MGIVVDDIVLDQLPGTDQPGNWTNTDSMKGKSMSTPTYAILRFEKHQGNPAKKIEDHHERNKTIYASNPDVDTSRSKNNFHIISPGGKYYAEIQQRIETAGCRTRKDSVRFVDTLITASPEFFDGKSRKEIRAFFTRACEFLKNRLSKENIISAVVHMDEKTPHMHLIFVPLTADNRLCAKEIIGNRQKLIQWQDDFWRYMVDAYPELDRGESASTTRRDHIPTYIYKQMTILTKQSHHLEDLLTSINPFNAKSKAAEIIQLLSDYIPNVERISTQMKKYRVAFTETKAENQSLREENVQLSQELDAAQRTCLTKQLQDAKLQREYREAIAVLDRIPKDILDQAKQAARMEKHQQKQR